MDYLLLLDGNNSILYMPKQGKECSELLDYSKRYHHSLYAMHVIQTSPQRRPSIDVQPGASLSHPLRQCGAARVCGKFA